MSRIFISYRREDTAGYAISLHDRLAARFGIGQIFRDIDGIEPGEDFHEIIREKIGTCEVLIVLIGPTWLTCRDESGQRRLEKPDDFVRLEVAVALERKIRVIPVLVGDARLPKPHELCPDLAPLCRRNAITLTDAGFWKDLSRLIESIEKLIPLSDARSPGAGIPSTIAAGLASTSGSTRARVTQKHTLVDPSVQLPAGALDKIRLGRPRILRRHGKPVKTVSFSPDSRLLVSGGGGSWLGGGDTAIRLWQVSDGRLLSELEGHEQTVTMVVFSPDGKRLGSMCSKAIHIWRISDGKHLRTLEGSGDIGGDSLAFSDDGRRLVCRTKTEPKALELWSVSDGKHLGSYSAKRLPGRASFMWQQVSPDGRMLASGEEITVEEDSYSAIVVKDVRSGTTLRELRGKNAEEPTEWRFSPDGLWLVAGYEDDVIRVWRVADGKRLAEIQVEDTPNSVAFSPDGRWLAAGCEDKLVRLWPLAPTFKAGARPSSQKPPSLKRSQ